MAWWETVYENIHVGHEFQTPGKGIEGTGAKLFKVIYKEPDLIIILTGGACLPLERSCIEAIEDAFRRNPQSTWRISSLHDKDPYPDSADRLIRERTGANLARGNYVCSILKSIGLVRYVMVGNKKNMELA